MGTIKACMAAAQARATHDGRAFSFRRCTMSVLGKIIHLLWGVRDTARGKYWSEIGCLHSVLASMAGLHTRRSGCIGRTIVSYESLLRSFVYTIQTMKRDSDYAGSTYHLRNPSSSSPEHVSCTLKNPDPSPRQTRLVDSI